MQKVMKKKKLSKRASIILISLSVVAITAGSLVYFTFFHRYKGKKVVDEWSKTDTFDINKITTLNKDPDKDFVILNLTDVQIRDLDSAKMKRTIHQEITDLINEYKPDLITLTGDQTMSNENQLTLRSLIRWLDSYKIPYAPVFGNHDWGDDYNSAVIGMNKSCDLYEKGKYSLFKRGPTNFRSLGNYVINIKENDKVIKSLYMMDLGYYDDLTTEQKDWFKWNADGIKANNNNEYSQAMIFTHKDLATRTAYSYYRSTNEGAEDGEVYMFNGLSYPREQEFVNDIVANYGATDFISGHLHNNNFTITYNGAKYTFATKTGQAVFYYEDEDVNLNGATEIRINKDKTKYIHHHVEHGKYDIE